MKNVLSLSLAALVLASLPGLSATPTPASPLQPADVLAAQPGEPVLLPALKALVLLPDATPADLAATATPGLHLNRVPVLAIPAVRRALTVFLDRPVSLASIGRMELALRVQLGLLGRPFARVYTPPQDITDGTVRVVVQLATAAADVKLAGNHWFSKQSYLDSLHVRPGEPLDLATINHDLAWLNRNPFRRVTATAEAGPAPGTTQLALHVQERRPLELATSFDNTGTPITGSNRLHAGFTWGDAFGRGDLLRYSYTTDPSGRWMQSDWGSYTAFLPWRHILTIQGAWAHLTPDLPAPFMQDGHSWQVGARYEIPLQAPHPGWTQNLAFTADFKSSDNNLEFAAIPITDNLTHIMEVGATYGVTLPAWGGQAGLTGTLYASPGHLDHRNTDGAFNGSRSGAHARYAYVKFGLQYSHPLPDGFSWQSTLDSQLASTALLGTEQINGGGSAAVRGYREDSAFGDSGVVVSNELHAPPIIWPRAALQMDAYIFTDFASLTLRHDHQSTDLRSVGLGANVLLTRYFSLRLSYGWQLKQLDRYPGEHGAGTLAASATW